MLRRESASRAKLMRRVSIDDVYLSLNDGPDL
jgi:hypothetical protein